MRLATLRRGRGTTAVRVEENMVVEVPGAPDVGALLADRSWAERARAADGAATPLAAVAPRDWAPVVPRPGKVVCVGLNYAAHIQEMGRDLPEHPTLFAKYPEALIGAFDAVDLPPEAPAAVDWEGELAVVVGSTARRVDGRAAEAAIAGYAILNDVSMRDFQFRTREWLQGKTFEHTTPFGPWLTTIDEFTVGAALRTVVDGEVVQAAATDGLVFSPATLVSYISHILTLNPGDVIATGTPGGVGHARVPPRYLQPGSVLETSIEGLGAQRNEVVRVGSPAPVAAGSRSV